jgi:predicted phosphoribosyltransferase
MFRDRKDGGEKLGNALSKYRDQNVLVLGIPRGGVETAYYVARHLRADLSLVVARKLGYPSNPEAAFGALAEDGSLFIFPDTGINLSDETIQLVIESEREEIKRRISELRAGEPLPTFAGKTVILVDDGIATGATLFAAIELCKKQKAGKIVVASPIAGKHMESILREKVDEVVILQTPDFYYAVSQGYYQFDNLSDEEVLSLMERWKKEKEFQS